MIVLTSVTAAALALHAAEGSWVMFLQTASPNGLGAIKIEGLHGRQMAARLSRLVKDSAYDIQLIGLMESPLPNEHVAQFAEEFAASHMHDGWFEYSTDLMSMIQHVGQTALKDLIGEVHPGSFDQDQLVDIEEIANILGVSIVTVRRWISLGRIPHYRAGKGYRFIPREVIASLQRHPPK